MNNDTNIRLIYEINGAQSKLDFAIKEAEYQLASVKKRLDSLQHDLIFYITMLVAPVILLAILSPLINLLITSGNPINYILGLFLQIFNMVLLCVYVIFFPMNLYHLANTIFVIRTNKEYESVDITLPPVIGSYKGKKPPQEPSLQSEYRKLIYVLTKYYIYVEKIEELQKQIHSDSCTLTMEELRSQLNQITYFENIGSANMFSSSMIKKARQKTKLIFLGVIFLIVIILFNFIKQSIN